MFESIWENLTTIASLTLGGVLLLAIDRLRAYLTRRWAAGNRVPLGSALRTSRQIHMLVFRLMIETRAGRAYVVQFHNGEYFSSRDPIWYITCTQEAAAEGVAAEQHHVQRQMYTLFAEWLMPLFDDKLENDDVPGLQVMTVGMHKVYYFTVRDMAESYAKSFLISRGCKAIAYSPILRNEQPVGFVACDFLDEKYRDPAARPEGLHRIAQCAANVWYEMTQTKRDRG